MVVFEMALGWSPCTVLLAVPGGLNLANNVVMHTHTHTRARCASATRQWSFLMAYRSAVDMAVLAPTLASIRGKNLSLDRLCQKLL